MCVRTAKFNTSWMALFFNAHHHRITLVSRALSLQESNQKRHFAFLCLALMMMMTKTILSYFNAIPFQSQSKSNRTAMACACVLWSVTTKQQQTPTIVLCFKSITAIASTNLFREICHYFNGIFVISLLYGGRYCHVLGRSVALSLSY